MQHNHQGKAVIYTFNKFLERLTSECVKEVLANIPAHGLKVRKLKQVCCFESLLYFICSEKDMGVGGETPPEIDLLINGSHVINSNISKANIQTSRLTLYRSCISMLRL